MTHRIDLEHDSSSPHFATQVSVQDLHNLIRLVSRDDVNYETIAKEFEKFSGVTLLMLKTANSAGLAAGQHVRSLTHAIAILGLQRVRALLSQMMDKLVAA